MRKLGVVVAVSLLMIVFVLVGFLSMLGAFPGNGVNAPIKWVAGKLNSIFLCNLIVLGERYGDYGVSGSKVRASCKNAVAAKSNNVNYCLRIKDKEQFTSCIEGVYRENQDDSVCRLLSDRGYYMAEQMCLQYQNTEQRTDNVKNVTMDTFRPQVDICIGYSSTYNKSSCLSGIGYRLGLRETANFEKFCLTAKADKYWLPCINWSHSGFLDMPKSVIDRALKEAESDKSVEKELCDSIRWHTYESKRIRDVELSQFGVNTCGLKYLGI